MIGGAEINRFFALSFNCFQINYHIILMKDDYPKIQVTAMNVPSKEMIFKFRTRGSFLGTLRSLKGIFKIFSTKTFKGDYLTWNWISTNEISINNGPYKNFIIEYLVNASNLEHVTFRKGRVFFIAGDIFLLPKDRPIKITVNFSLPSGITVFSSLPKENNKFIATTDLWGDIIYDFQKAYFIGGRTIFHLEYQTEWGDKYIYIWFYKDAIDQAWLPSYGLTPWEEAEKYMKTTELFAKYYRKIIGPLPKHIVLFTNTITINGIPVINNVDWFHHMQIWPKFSEPEIVHHLFHQYSFWISQSKLSFWEPPTPVGSFLSEGITTYYEQLIPTLLLNDPHYFGKIFEFFVLNERGKRFNIEDNVYHISYNVGALKVYLLNKYIREKTNDVKNLDSFVRELWNYVKDNKKPQQITDDEIIDIFRKVVNDTRDTYILDLTYKKDFDVKDFVELLPYFKSYMNWMANKYFWNNKLLFLCFLDIVAVKGNEWPHYATYPHNILWYRNEALIPFKEYLTNLGKNDFTKEDIIDALNHVTKKDHSGFFKFWNSLDIELDPNFIKPLSKWDPNEITEDSLVTAPWECVGLLETEHYLAGFPQKAKAVLDYPDSDGKIVIEVQAISFHKYLHDNQAKQTLSGANVSLLRLARYKYRNLFVTSVFFKVETNDINRQVYNFSLTLPSSSFYLKFRVYNDPIHSKDPIGNLYWISSIEPIKFSINAVGNYITLPDTYLENESYLIKFSNIELHCNPKDAINIFNLFLKSAINVSKFKNMRIEIMLYDKFGFLRGIKYIPVTNLTKDFRFYLNYYLTYLKNKAQKTLKTRFRIVIKVGLFSCYLSFYPV